MVRRSSSPDADRHIDRRTLWDLALGTASVAELAEEALSHLLRTCPECRDAYRRAREGLERERLPSLGEARYEGLSPGGVDPNLVAEVKIAVHPIETLLEGPPATWSEILGIPELTTWGAVDLLIHRCRQTVFDDPRRAEAIAVLAVSLADRLDEQRYGRRFLADLRAVAWAWLGNARRVVGGLPAAEQALEAAQDWLERGVGEPRNRAQVIALVASLRRDQLRFEEAHELLDRALELYSTVEDRHLEGRILVKKASVASFEGRPAEAARLLERALLALDPARDARLELCARHGLALALVDTGQLDEAEAVVRKARALYERFPDGLTRGREFWLLGRLAARRGRLDEAAELLGSARSLLAETGASFDAALAGLELAALAVRRGDLEAAGELAREMLPLFRSHAVHRGAIEALVALDRAVRAEEGLSAELLSQLARFLVRARRNPDLELGLEATG